MVAALQLNHHQPKASVMNYAQRTTIVPVAKNAAATDVDMDVETLTNLLNLFPTVYT